MPPKRSFFPKRDPYPGEWIDNIILIIGAGVVLWGIGWVLKVFTSGM
jgi:hypothetical protein